ncbi:MAG: hypothetical protein ACR2L6_10915 [Gemmatimonadaceae bacterium]
MRRILELWFSHLPDEKKSSVRRSFAKDFDAAFFELLLHELLLASGYDVEIHPSLTSSLETHPDFLARHNEYPECFVEARVSSDKSAASSAEERMLAQLYDEIDRAPLKDYSLWLEKLYIPPTQFPSARRFMRRVHEVAAALSYEEVVKRSSRVMDSLPSVVYREGDALIEARLVPLPRDRPAQARSRAIGAFPVRTRWGAGASAIQKVLKRKSSKYGRLAAPFLVAVNSISEWGTDNRDVVNALYGSEAVRWDLTSDTTHLIRNRDGFWLGPVGVQNRRVSAALVGSVSPYNLHVANLRLYVNPWAEAPYSGPLLCLPRTSLVDDRITETEGAALREILSVPLDWPGEKEEG